MLQDPAPDSLRHAGAIESYLVQVVGQRILSYVEEKLLIWKRLLFSS